MYAHQAGVMEEGEQTWHWGQLGVSEVRKRERGGEKESAKQIAFIRPQHSFLLMIEDWFYYCVINENTFLQGTKKETRMHHKYSKKVF